MGQHLKAFSGCLLHAGLRPGEAVILGEDALEFPGQEGQPGWIHLGGSAPSSDSGWNETGGRRERRGLKHRSDDETRPVPMAPVLARCCVSTSISSASRQTAACSAANAGACYLAEALTPAEVRSPLAERPYDLRHACLTRWLNAGIDPALVAEWAGNSVPVLLSTYAKCVAGSERAALKHLGWLKDTAEETRTPPPAEQVSAAGGGPQSAGTGSLRPGRQEDGSWFQLARAYAAAKLGTLAPESRRAVTDALTVATEALLEAATGRRDSPSVLRSGGL